MKYVETPPQVGSPRRTGYRNIWKKEEEKNVGPLFMTKQSHFCVVRQRLGVFSKPFQTQSKPKAKPFAAGQASPARYQA
jgi:hypothetical protein